MWRALLTRKWLAALAAALLCCAVCVALGGWQYGRHLDKAYRAELVERHYAASPVPLDDVLPRGAGALPADAEWTRVAARGHYDADARLMVRNRPQNVVYGYEVLVPLDLDDGTALLVDRGWVRNAERADVVPAVPPPPPGPVDVTGWLRRGEPTVGSGLPAGQLASIDLAQAGAATGRPLRAAYLVLDREDDGSGVTPERPAPLLPPDTGLGPHFAYALQWWLAAPIGFIVVGVYLRREVADASAPAGTPVAAPPRPRKVRIWDEEDG